MKKRYAATLVIGAILGFLASEFRPKETIPLPDISKYDRQIDSLEAQNSLIADSLSKARFVLANRERELGQAHRRTAEALKQKHEIPFTPTIRDSQRDSILAELYPTSKVF